MKLAVSILLTFIYLASSVVATAAAGSHHLLD
jgi:hypothetical protein